MYKLLAYPPTTNGIFIRNNHFICTRLQICCKVLSHNKGIAKSVIPIVLGGGNVSLLNAICICFLPASVCSRQLPAFADRTKLLELTKIYSF